MTHANQLPPGWAWSSLGEIGDYQNGRAFSERDWSTEGRPIIRIQNLTGTGAHFNRFSGEVEERHLVRDGDLLVSWAATLGAFIWHGEEAALNQHIFKVRSYINRSFHRWAVEYALQELNRRSHGSGMVHVTKKVFDSAAIPLPPSNEQIRVVAEVERRLSHVDVAEVSLRTTARRLTAARNAVLDALSNGSLLGLDASTWKEVTTGEVTDVRGGIQKQPKRTPLENKCPFLRVANVGRGRLHLDDVHEVELFDGELDRYRLRRGDLLVVEGNGSVSQIGRAAMWDGSLDDCVHQNHLIRIRPDSNLLPDFLAYLWNAPSTVRQLTAVASSTSGLHTLSTKKIRSVSLRLPTIDDQRALLEEAERRLSHADAAAQSIELSSRRAQQLRRAVLTDAFAGRLVPQDSDDEPADMLLDRIRAERAAAPAARTRRRAPKETTS